MMDLPNIRWSVPFLQPKPKNGSMKNRKAAFKTP
jgi:hypothetical protein